MSYIHGDWSLRDEMAVILCNPLISAYERTRRLTALAERHLEDIPDDDFDGMADALEEWMGAVFDLLGDPSPMLH